MRVEFLGTGTSQGIPVIGCGCAVCTSASKFDNRLRVSVHIAINQKSLVIDSGPDFRYQMLRSGITKLDAILYTHQHKDHVAGLDDVRPFNFFNKKPIDLYCTNEVEKALKREFYYAFEESKYPGVPELTIHQIHNDPFHIDNIKITPIQVYHHKMPVLGFRIGDFCYITDANQIPENEFDKIYGCKVLVLNALRRTSHISHFTMEEAITIASKLNVGKLYLTHISHQLGLHEDILNETPEWVEPAYDGLVLEL